MLVDTNVLVYAINVASPKHDRAREFLKDHQENLSIAHQNIFEALRVLTHNRFPNPMKPKSAIESVSAITQACQIIVPDHKTSYIALELIKKHGLSGNQMFDAYLAATALSNETNVIATDNERHFQDFPGIRIFNPFK